MALRSVALLFVLTFTPAGAFRWEMGSLTKARAEAAQAMEAASQAVARARAAQQKVKDLGGVDEPDRPFWFMDLFPDQARDAKYSRSPYTGEHTPIDDLGILYAVIKETRPKTMVEIGFSSGDGTRAILSAADTGTTCHSFDPYPKPGMVEKLRAEVPGTGRNFVFHLKSGKEISPEDVGGEKVGFAFLDAAHNTTQSAIMFEKLLPMLTEDAIVAVHDTGGWGKKFVDEHMEDERMKVWWQNMGTFSKQFYPEAWPLPTHGEGDEQYYLHPHADHERQFINWVTEVHPEWGVINFNSLNTLRMGVTMMQRQRKFETN